jgi:hypothetical protein
MVVVFVGMVGYLLSTTERMSGEPGEKLGFYVIETRGKSRASVKAT